MSQPRNEGLPRSVTHALEAITCSQRALAYLQVDAEFTLVGAGGNLGERAPLFGRSPATGQSAFFLLPCIEIGGGHPADLHFYLDDACVWVVLLDATAERDQAQRVQQKAYDMTLLLEKQALLNRRLEAANAALRAAQDELETARDVAEQARATVKAGYDTWFFLTADYAFSHGLHRLSPRRGRPKSTGARAQRSGRRTSP